MLHESLPKTSMSGDRKQAALNEKQIKNSYVHLPPWDAAQHNRKNTKVKLK